MNARDTVFAHLKLFPEFYDSRAVVLNHLLLTSGAGHDWNVKTGELSEEIFDPKTKKFAMDTRPLAQVLEDGHRARAESEKRWNRLFGTFKVFAPERSDEEIERLLAEPLEVAKPIRLYAPTIVSFSRLGNFPESITKDWQDAVREFSHFVLALPPAGKTHVIASLALQRLAEL